MPSPPFYVPNRAAETELPENSTNARDVYQLIHDEMSLDFNPLQNLASFVTTWMEPEALQLVQDSLSKNFADQNQYPHTLALQERCVNMISNLFHAPSEKGVGTNCVGSSEALMLGALAMKKKWMKRRKEQGKPYNEPNIVMCSTIQIAWKKFCNYFDVDIKITKVSRDVFTLDPEQAIALVDENTIGVVAVLGSTYTGHYDPIKELNDRLVALNEEKGWNVGIHVDAASGGFVAPFLNPELEWDFRLPLVKSINVSGHKYGGVYPGVGWVVWRDESELPKELVFDLHYLGGVEQTFTLNFSRSSSHMVLQYYNFLRLGREGYTKITSNCRSTAKYMKNRLLQLNKFEILSDDHSVPLVAFKLKDEVKGYTVYDISDKMKEAGWSLPAYKMSEGAEDVALLRAVIRYTFKENLVDIFIKNIQSVIHSLESKYEEQQKNAHNFESTDIHTSE